MSTVTTRMDPLYKSLWVAALRGGSNRIYQQTHAPSMQECKKKGGGWGPGMVLYSVADPKAPRSGIPPEETWARTRITQEGIDFVDHMNESERLSFAEIADWIEANL